MRQLRSLLLLSFFCVNLLMISSRLAAQCGHPAVPSDTGSREWINQIRFDGSLAKKVCSDSVRDYYLMDLTKFSCRFELLWFMNLVFQDDKLVNIDPNVDHDRMWFTAVRRYPEQEILEVFGSLFRRAQERTGQLSLQEQENWLKRNDKYHVLTPGE